jgi:RHS repeat-associated protein
MSYFLDKQFAGKEADEETGLIYFGARYLDPQTSMWLSTDPAMGEYVPGAGQDASKLPGMGGVYNSVNMHVFAYAGNNPIIYIDPDGEFLVRQFIFAALQTAGGVVQVVAGCAGEAPSAGVTTFLILHGVKDVGDGFIGMVAAAKDREYGGITYETTRAILDRTTDFSEDTKNTISGGVSLAEGAVSIGASNSVPLANVIKNGETVDTLSTVASYAGLVNTAYDTIRPQSARSQQAQPMQNQQTTRSPQTQPTQVGPGIPGGQNAVYSPDSLRRSGQNNVNANNNQYRTTYPGLNF